VEQDERTFGTDDLEWLLSQHFTVERQGDLVLVPFEEARIGAEVVQITEGSRLVNFRSLVADNLTADPALFRWVAVEAGKHFVGALYARVGDEGQVDVWIDHAVPATALDADGARLIVGLILGSTVTLRTAVRDLFS
jgi:hypothetical protein